MTCRLCACIVCTLIAISLGPISAQSAPEGEPAFAGIWTIRSAIRGHGSGGTGALYYDQSWDQLVKKWKSLGGRGQYLADVESYRRDGAWRYAAVWRVGPRQGALLLAPWEKFVATWKKLAITQELIDLEVIHDGQDWKFLGVWRLKPKPTPGFGALFVGLSWDELLAKRAKLAKSQYLADVETYVKNGKRLFAGVWRLGGGNGALYWQNKWKAFAALNHKLRARQRMVDFELFQTGDGRWNFLGVWRVAKNGGPLEASTAKRTFRPLHAAQFVDLWKAHAKRFTLTGLAVATPGDGRKSSGVRRIDYLGNHPADRNAGWNEDLQGVATDRHAWYFTNMEEIWKFPLTHDLNSKVRKADPARGVLRSFQLGDSHTPSELKGYNHFGDPDVYHGRLYVPVEKSKGNWIPRIAVFNTKTLKFIDSYPLKPGDGFKQTHAGWCAIDPLTGYLYTSNNHIDQHNPIFVYRVRFVKSRGLVLDYKTKFQLWQQANKLQDIKAYMQGGVFSSDGSTLYLLNGKSYNFRAKDGGIWVFDVPSGRRIMKSATSGNFRYEFHPIAARSQEPEGIAFLDLNGKNAPGIPKGQLHAILLNNNAGKNRDTFWFKHYLVQ